MPTDDGGWGEFVPKPVSPPVAAAPDDGGWSAFVTPAPAPQAPVMPKDPRATSGFQNFAKLTGMTPENPAQTAFNQPVQTIPAARPTSANPWQSMLPNVFATQRQAAAPPEQDLSDPTNDGFMAGIANIPRQAGASAVIQTARGAYGAARGFGATESVAPNAGVNDALGMPNFSVGSMLDAFASQNQQENQQKLGGVPGAQTVVNTAASVAPFLAGVLPGAVDMFGNKFSDMKQLGASDADARIGAAPMGALGAAAGGLSEVFAPVAKTIAGAFSNVAAPAVGRTAANVIGGAAGGAAEGTAANVAMAGTSAMGTSIVDQNAAKEEFSQAITDPTLTVLGAAGHAMGAHAEQRNKTAPASQAPAGPKLSPAELDARAQVPAGEGDIAKEDQENPVASEPHPLLDKGPIPQEVVRRQVNIVRDQAIPDTAGASQDGKTAYFDKSYPQSITDEAAGDTYDPAPYTALHERVEQYAVNELGMDYAKAHDLATEYEHAALVEDGHDPETYEAGLKPYIDEAGHRRSPENAPADVEQYPYKAQGDLRDLGDTTKGEAPAVEGTGKPSIPGFTDGENMPAHVFVDEHNDVHPMAKEDRKGAKTEGDLKPVPVGEVKPEVIEPAKMEGVEPAATREQSEEPKPEKAARGAVKGAIAEKAVFGPEKGAKAPESFQPGEARIFKDAGKTAVNTRKITDQNLHLIQHPSGKAMLGMSTDAKGRPQEGGPEIRPINAQGRPTTIASTKHDAMIFPSVEAAAKHAVKLAPAVPDIKKAEAAGGAELSAAKSGREKPIAAAKGDEAIRADLAKHKAEADEINAQIMDSGEPTEAQVNRLGELADKMDEMEATLSDREQAKKEAAPEPEAPAGAERAIKRSPMIDATRRALSEDLPDEEMSPDSVAKLVKNALTRQLDEPATPRQVRDALMDLHARKLITDKQAGADVGQSAMVRSVDPVTALLAATLPVAGVAAKRFAVEAIKHAKDDLPSSVAAHVDRAQAPVLGEFGARGRVLGNFLSRTVFRGEAGPAITDKLARIGHLAQAKGIAAFHPDFAPILQRARDMVDGARQRFIQNGAHLEALQALQGESKDRVNAALIQFRLDETKAADFDKPFSFVDSRGNKQKYTLTKDEINTVNQVYDANRKLLEDYVDTLKDKLGLPKMMNSALLEKAVINGTVSGAASSLLLEALRTLENDKANYVPFMRFGGYKAAAAYDLAKFNAAKTAEERHDALLGSIKAKGAADYEAQMKDFVKKFPNAKIMEFNDGPRENEIAKPQITEAQLRELADHANVPWQVFSDFWNAGVGDAIRTQGMRARFREASMVPGMSTDMARVNALHARSMTHAIEMMKGQDAIGKMVNGLKDTGLREYAKRFQARMSAPAPMIASTLRHLAMLKYLGFAPLSALMNGSQALLLGPAQMAMAAHNAEPLRHAREAVDMLGKAIINMTGIPFALHKAGIGAAPDLVSYAMRKYAKDAGLVAALKDANEKGTFSSTAERNLLDLTKGVKSFGSKVISGLTTTMMHFFNQTETANRVAMFVSAYKSFESQKNNTGFNRFHANMGFVGKTPGDFGRWYSDMQNQRQDQFEMPEPFQGKFQKDQSGKMQFQSSNIRQSAYSLQSWSVGYMTTMAAQVRAAWKGGWIDRAMYMAVTAGLVATLGLPRIIPGLNVEDAAERFVERHPTTNQQDIEHSGTAGRILVKGGTGVLAEMLTGSHKLADNLENLAGRVGPGNMIPVGSLTDSLPVLGMGHDIGAGFGELTQKQSPRAMAETIAGMVGNEPKRLVKGANMLTSEDGYTDATGKTSIPDESKALPGAPAISTADKVGYLFGLTPPQVGRQFEIKQAEETMKKAAVPALQTYTERFMDALETKDPVEREAAMRAASKDLQSYNMSVIATGEPWKAISHDQLSAAVKQMAVSRVLGSVNVKKAPKLQRPEILKLQAQDLKGDETKPKP